jgi:hypothetical protein
MMIAYKFMNHPATIQDSGQESFWREETIKQKKELFTNLSI